MTIRTTTVAVSMLILATIANADDRYQRRDDRNVNGRIAWSTRDRSGNRFSVSFDFNGRNVGFNVDYRQDRRVAVPDSWVPLLFRGSYGTAVLQAMD